MLTFKHSLIAIFVASALSACGGSDDPAPTPTPTPTPTSSTGKAVDGYISGATVVCDTDGDGVQDSGEATATTNATGDFSFSPACGSKLFLTGGTNTETNLPYLGKLQAPAGSTVVTPITSLVAAGLSNAQVITLLGLPAGTNVLTTDPQAAGGDLKKKTLAVQQVLQQVTNTVANGATVSEDGKKALFEQSVKSVAAALLANPTTPLFTGTDVASAVLTTAIKKTVSDVQTSTNTALSSVKTEAAKLTDTTIASKAAEIQTQAQALTKASDADLVNTAKTQQDAANKATQALPTPTPTLAPNVTATPSPKPTVTGSIS